MKLPAFEYACPATPADVVQLLATTPGAKVIAGGQSLLPTMAFRLANPTVLVDLRNIEGLNYLRVNADGVHIGARTRWCDLTGNAALTDLHPLLAAALPHIAHYQIRNRGTVGGSLAHADPAAELPCIAATCDARLRVLGPSGERVIAAPEFFIGPLMTILHDDELILELQLPPWQTGRRWAFTEFSRRHGDFALAGIALHYDVDPGGRAIDAHIGVVGACQQPSRLPAAEAALNGRVVDPAVAAAVAEAAGTELDPPADIHASAEYRRSLAMTLLEQSVLEAAART